MTAKIENLSGFSYVSGSTSLAVGGTPICEGAGDNDEPQVVGSALRWDIDARCPNDAPFTLASGQTLTLTFNLETDCTAVSGSLNTFVDYRVGGTPAIDDTGAHSIKVLPGGVTIKKAPSVIPQEVGQDVTWTLTIENTGYGTIKNVVVTDVLSDGLSYVSSSPAGVNVGQTTTWGPSQKTALADMDPGEIATVALTATVIACENLDNEADVRWGCDLVTDCFNTATDGGTATASVQRIVKTPSLMTSVKYTVTRNPSPLSRFATAQTHLPTRSDA